MRHLLASWKQVARDLGRAAHILLLLDFDGTLAPIVDHPQDAWMLPRAAGILHRLSKSPRCTLGFVSGRRLSDLERRVIVPHSHYSGNHGLELDVKGLGVFWAKLADGVGASLSLVARKVEQDLGSVPGVWVEDKSLSLTIHYRRVASEQVPEVLDYLNDLASGMSALLEMHRGKKVVEIRPAGGPDKGRVLHAMVYAEKRQRDVTPLVFYLGDDEGDEPAFAAVEGKGYGVRVGVPVQTSRAEYWLSGPEEVAGFLGLVESFLTGTNPTSRESLTR